MKVTVVDHFRGSTQTGMSRDDLISINAGIVKSITENVIKHSPNAIVIVVSNPLDVMTYVAYAVAKTSKNKVLGMAGMHGISCGPNG